MVMRQMVALPLTEVINWIKVLWNTIAQMIMLRRSSKVPSIKKIFLSPFCCCFFWERKFPQKILLNKFFILFSHFFMKKIFGSFWFSPKKNKFFDHFFAIAYTKRRSIHCQLKRLMLGSKLNNLDRKSVFVFVNLKILIWRKLCEVKKRNSKFLCEWDRTKKNGNGGWEDERWISESISPIKMCQI